MGPLSLFEDFFAVCFLFLCVCWWFSGCSRNLLLFGTFCLILFGRSVINFAAKLGANGWNFAVLVLLILGIVGWKCAGVWLPGPYATAYLDPHLACKFLVSSCILVPALWYNKVRVCCLMLRVICTDDLLVYGPNMGWLTWPNCFSVTGFSTVRSLQFQVLSSSGFSPTNIGPSCLNWAENHDSVGPIFWTVAAVVIWSLSPFLYLLLNAHPVDIMKAHVRILSLSSYGFKLGFHFGGPGLLFFTGQGDGPGFLFRPSLLLVFCFGVRGQLARRFYQLSKAQVGCGLISSSWRIIFGVFNIGPCFSYYCHLVLKAHSWVSLFLVEWTTSMTKHSLEMKDGTELPVIDVIFLLDFLCNSLVGVLFPFFVS